jgi:hypothetical protein
MQAKQTGECRVLVNFSSGDLRFMKH